MLSLLGAGLGLLLAVWGVELLTSLKPRGHSPARQRRVDAHRDRCSPSASRSSPGCCSASCRPSPRRAALSASLKEGGRGAVTSRGGARVRGALVVAELALAVMLLAGAGLLMRSFVRLQSVDPGFKPEQALTFELTLPDARYEEDPQRVAFFDQLLPRLRGLPGVRSASAVIGLPLSGARLHHFVRDRRPPAGAAGAAAGDAGPRRDARLLQRRRHSAEARPRVHARTTRKARRASCSSPRAPRGSSSRTKIRSARRSCSDGAAAAASPGPAAKSSGSSATSRTRA